MIGYPTQSLEMTNITLVTFYVLFLNTAWLLLLVNANMTEQPITFGLNGNMSDFNSDWFRTTGNLMISTMIFNAYYPILEFVGFWALRLWPRLSDSGWTLDHNKTKTTSVQGYIDIWGGPLFYTHFKYSSVLNIVFVTFMYGFGLPILFPIACVTFAVTYIIEKSSLYYSYRQPPAYDATLSNTCLEKMWWAPVLYIAFGYWMASSKQLNSNENLDNYLETTGSVFMSNHIMTDVFLLNGWSGLGFAMLFTFVAIIVLYFFGGLLMEYLSEKISWIKIGDIELEEEIDNYWNCLDEEDREWAIKEEEYAHEVLNMPIMLPENLQKLKEAKK